MTSSVLIVVDGRRRHRGDREGRARGRLGRPLRRGLSRDRSVLAMTAKGRRRRSVRRVGHAPGHGEANRAASVLGRSRTRAVPVGCHRRRRPRRSAHRPRRGCRRTPPAPPHRSLGHRSCRAWRRRPRPHQPRRQPAVPRRAAGPCRRGRRACRHASASAGGGPVLERTPTVPAVGRRTDSRARPPTLPQSVSLRGRRAASPEPRRRCGGGARHPRRPRARGTRA